MLLPFGTRCALPMVGWQSFTRPRSRLCEFTLCDRTVGGCAGAVVSCHHRCGCSRLDEKDAVAQRAFGYGDRLDGAPRVRTLNQARNVPDSMQRALLPRAKGVRSDMRKRGSIPFRGRRGRSRERQRAQNGEVVYNDEMILSRWLHCGGVARVSARLMPMILVGCGANQSSPPSVSRSPAEIDSGAPVAIGVTEPSVDASTASTDAALESSPAPSSTLDRGAPLACEWTDVGDPTMKPFRANAHRLLDEYAPSEKPNAITCCALSDSDALCRTRSHRMKDPRAYRYAVYTRLVGVSATQKEAWFDAPYEVADYKSMKQVNPPWDLELSIAVRGATFTVRDTSGKCPRACSKTTAGCKKWEEQAERACGAIGTYERANGSLIRR